jgi:integrase
MASLSKDGSGWRILFVCPSTGKRHTVRTGRCAKKNAETARNMIERLVESKQLGTAFDGPTTEWLKGIDGKLRNRLAKVGLVEAASDMRLAKFLDGYIDNRRRRGDVTASTIEVWGHTKRNLIAFFGADRNIRTITAKDADEWAAWLKTSEKLAENTIRKRSQFAKRFFSVAVKRKLIPEDPFASLVGTVVSVPERKFFISRETVDALLDQCAGPEFRLLLVFARYMGVRVPSEIHPLKWSDVDWEGQRIVITSPKTKRHKGGDKRVCPIFPEVLPFLQAAWEAAPEGAFWMFPSIRSGRKNLRSWLDRAIIRAGFAPWPRLWQNFRATRATELADQYPSHVAAAWLGHTERIADGHYRQVTADHYQRAVKVATGALPTFGAGVKKLAQIPAHSPHFVAPHGSARNPKSPGKSADCGALSDSALLLSGGHGTRTRNPSPGAPHFQCGR